MRKNLIAAVAAITALLSGGCTPSTPEGDDTVSVSATIEGLYRWQPGDVLAWYEDGRIGSSEPVDASCISAEGRTASFEVNLPLGTSRQGFFAYGFRQSGVVDFPASFTQSSAGVLPSSSVHMHGGMGICTLDSGSATVNMQMAGTILRIFPYAAEASDETVQSVTVSSGSAIAGKVKYDHARSAYTGMTDPAGNEISVKLRTGFPLKGVSSQSSSKAVFVPVPATGGNGSSAVNSLEGGIKVEVTTDKAGYSFAFPEMTGFADGRCVDIAVGLDAAHRMDDKKIYGTVCDTEGRPFAGAVVSDGTVSVQADDDGRFSFAPAEGAKFIQCSIPAEAAIVKEGQYGIPCSYYKTLVPAVKEYDFTFGRQSKESEFRILCLGDPQTKSSTRTKLLKTETVPDINDYIKTHKGSAFYGITAGDNVENTWDLLPDIAEIYGMVEAPVFPTIGNHDHEYPTSGEPAARNRYEAVFGPSNYSFNRGDVHILVVDDIIHEGTSSGSYQEGLEQSVIDWVKSDLQFVPKDKFLLVSLHAPLSTSYPLAKQLTALLKPYAGAQIIAGHTHNVQNEKNIDGISQCAVGSCGAPWKGLILSDGCVRGYKVFTFKGNAISDEIYKSIGHPEDYQMRMYRTTDYPDFDNGGSVQKFAVSGKDVIAVNCFNYKSSWKVEAYENGKKTTAPVSMSKSCDVWARLYMYQDYGVDSDSGVNTHMLFYTLVDKACTDVRIVAYDEWGRTFQVDRFTTDFTDAKRQ